MKKIGILYICTGKYDIFRKDFYDSCEKYLLKETEKHYFVFTDSEKIKTYYSKNARVHIIHQENLGWPDNTLKRFHIFLSQEKELEKMDYLFFFNANLEIKKDILEKDFLPDRNNQIVVCKHPGFYNKKNTKFTYDRNPKSSAYIKKGEGEMYVQGALNGGTSTSFLEMCSVLKDNTDIDQKNGVIALWHDESHLNKYVYLLQKAGETDKIKVLDSSYLYPEWATIPFECKILIRDKEKYLNINNIKNFSLYKKLINGILKKFYKLYQILFKRKIFK